MTLSDKELAFEQIFTKYSKDIFRFAYLRLSSYEAAEDLTSEVFIKFWHKFKAENVINNDRALLYTIAHGLVIDEYRKNKSKEIVSIEITDERLLTRFDSIEKEIDVREAMSDVHKKLQTLKPEVRDILLMFYIDELSTQEIAQLLKKPEGTVRVMVHRALGSLRKMYG